MQLPGYCSILDSPNHWRCLATSRSQSPISLELLPRGSWHRRRFLIQRECNTKNSELWWHRFLQSVFQIAPEPAERRDRSRLPWLLWKWSLIRWRDFCSAYTEGEDYRSKLYLPLQSRICLQAMCCSYTTGIATGLCIRRWGHACTDWLTTAMIVFRKRPKCPREMAFWSNFAKIIERAASMSVAISQLGFSSPQESMMYWPWSEGSACVGSRTMAPLSWPLVGLPGWRTFHDGNHGTWQRSTVALSARGGEPVHDTRDE